MTKFADSVKQAANLTSTATISLTGAASIGFRTWAQAIADTAGKLEQVALGDTVCARVDDVTDPSKYEIATYTIGGTAQAPILTRVTILTSSAGGISAVTFGGPVTVLCTVPGSYLVGTPLADYLVANMGSTPQGADLIPSIQGSGLFGIAVSALGAVINKLWPGVAASVLTINSTSAFPLDFSAHHRRRIFCAAAPTSINAPALYSTVGDGFECDIVNISGTAIPFGSGIVGLPSGSSIPVGGVVRVFSGGGVIYANLNSSGPAVAATPAQVTGLTAGTPTSTTQPLSWTAVSGATGYKVEYKLHTDSTWTVAFANNTTTSCTVPSLTAAQSYDYRVSALNGSGPGVVSATVTASTAAAAAAAPFTLVTSAPGDTYGAFPAVRATYSPNYWSVKINNNGAVTPASAVAGLSESNTVAPTSAITVNGPVGSRGSWLGHEHLEYSPALLLGDNGDSNGVSASVPTPLYLYFWMIITDSNGAVWKFVTPATVKVGDGLTNVDATTNSTMLQVQ